MRRSNEARISAVVMVGLRALTEPMLSAEAICPAFSCCGGISEMKFSLRAGLVMGGFSIFGLSSGVVFLGVPDLMNSASSEVRMSLNVLRLATGHYLQKLLHFVRGGECGRAPQGRKTLSARTMMARVVSESPAGPSMTMSSASAASLATRRIITSGSSSISTGIDIGSALIQAEADY